MYSVFVERLLAGPEARDMTERYGLPSLWIKRDISKVPVCVVAVDCTALALKRSARVAINGFIYALRLTLAPAFIAPRRLICTLPSVRCYRKAHDDVV
jgi:hypothetical protein